MNAQNAGAIAVVIANNVAGDAPITLGGDDPTVTIPVVSITLDAGNEIKAQLGTGVNVTLALDPNQLAGTDCERPRQNVRAESVRGRIVGLPLGCQRFSESPYGAGDQRQPLVGCRPHTGAFLGYRLARSRDGHCRRRHPGSKDTGLALLPNYPNPFNPGTTIRYDLSSAQQVRLSVYDVRGGLVKSLSESVETAGVHEVSWQGKDNQGQDVASGIYFVRLQGENQVATRKVILLK